ncbi:MAG: sigma-54-dependent transcriptional regulator [Pyrinomonadaceae bacterium]
MPQHNVLLVEDEELMRRILRELLEAEGYSVLTADSAETALEIFGTADVAVTLTDIRMGGRDGLDLLDRIKSLEPDAIVIVMTAYSSVDSAIAALRKGAYDYITKPFVNEDIVQSVKNGVAHRELFRENRLLRRELSGRYDFSEIVGQSDGLRSVFDLVRKVASTGANVLLQGESGTGKELVARSIHFNSERSGRPFLAINCGALPESLLESELFGHKRGAFTGAYRDKPGLFRSASGGTLFLDEVGEMPATLQVKLLRALQEFEVTPVGASRAEKFDARIIAATNRDLEDEVAAGRFRDDLFYRLNVVEISIPPLRERRDDIPLLARHFATAAARRQRCSEKSISPEAMTALVNYSWPGNVRELENAVERAFILSSDLITLDDLPPKVRASVNGAIVIRDVDGMRPTLDEVERRYIYDVLESVDRDKGRAAEILGIDLSTLYRKLKRYEGSKG